MNGKQYAEHLGIPHGTVKRWRIEGLPATLGDAKSRTTVVIDPAVADAWVKQHHPNSVSFARKSVVYFIQREDDLCIKIGFSSDILRRVHELQRDEKCGMTLLAAFPGEKPDELALHARFAVARFDGEWFWPEAEILDFLKTLKGAA